MYMLVRGSVINCFPKVSGRALEDERHTMTRFHTLSAITATENTVPSSTISESHLVDTRLFAYLDRAQWVARRIVLAPPSVSPRRPFP